MVGSPILIYYNELLSDWFYSLFYFFCFKAEAKGETEK